MKNNKMKLAVGLMAFSVLCSAHAVPTVNVPETWDTDESGWTQSGGATLGNPGSGGNPGGYLEASLPISGVPAIYQVYADGSTAGGIYAGNQTYSAGINVVFDFMWDNVDNTAPAGLSLYFYSSTSGNEWVRPISTLPAQGDWGSYGVSMIFADGWDLALGGGDETTFLADLLDVDRIGFWVGVESTPNLQYAGFDNFELQVPEPNTVFFLSAVLLSLGASFRRNVAGGLRWARGLFVKA